MANPRINLIEARKSLKLKPKEMADKLGISVSYYYKFERGTRDPNLYIAKDISSILGEPIEILFLENRLPASSKLA